MLIGGQVYCKQMKWLVVPLLIGTPGFKVFNRELSLAFNLVVIVVNKSFSLMRNSPHVNLSLFLYSKRSLLTEHTQKYSITLATLTCSRQLRLNGNPALI